MRKIPNSLRAAFIDFCVEVMEEAKEKEAGKYKPWTKEDAQALVEMRESGVSYAEIAKKLNRTTPGCEKYYRLIKEGKVQQSKPRSNAWTEEQIEILVRMKDAGASYPEIAKAVNRSVNACRNKRLLLKKAN